MTDPKQPPLQCSGCDRLDAVRYRQNTRYVEDERNFVTLCPECRQKNDQHWSDMWADYYSDCL